MSVILDIHRAGSKSYRDYISKQKAIKSELDSTLWSNISDNDKYLVIRYFIVGSEFADSTEANTAKVGFLMSKGLSLPEAQNYLLESFAEHHKNEIPACRARANSKQLNKVVLSYLSEEEATDFTEKAKILFDLYTTHARKGTNDNSKLSGLFNFIEGNGDFSTSGLEHHGYTLSKGTWAEFKTEIMDVLRNGNY